MVPALVLSAVVLGAAPAWSPIAEGVEHLRVEGVELLRFSLAHWAADVVVVHDPKRLMTAEEMRVETKAAAAVNGGFFDENRRPLGLRIARGRRLHSLRRNSDWGVLVISEKHASIVHTREYKQVDSTRAAIQVGPRLLVAGEVVKLKPQSARRTAVALDEQGRTLTLVTAPTPIEASGLAELLARLGFHSAMLLDGGPSTQLSVELGDFSREIAGAYPVPDGLVLRPR